MRLQQKIIVFGNDGIIRLIGIIGGFARRLKKKARPSTDLPARSKERQRGFGGNRTRRLDFHGVGEVSKIPCFPGDFRAGGP
jgi:hypothetical protein